MKLGTLKFTVTLVGLGAAFLFLTGCGPAQGSLSGKVTFDGAPLTGGRVDFYNKSGGQSSTVEIAEDGSYSIPVLFAAEYDVTVTTDYLKGTSGPRLGGTGRPGGAKGGIPKDNKEAPQHVMPEGYVASMPGDSAKRYVKIPAKYGEPGESGLVFDFKGGNETYGIALSSK